LQGAVFIALLLRFMKIKDFELALRGFLMFLSRIIDYPLAAPDMLQLCFTFRCGLRCKMCNMHNKMEELKKAGKPYELSVPLMKNLISQAHRMKIKEVYFIGGEPFIEENIFDLISYASGLGMRTVINTNGLLLSDDKIEKVFDSGLSSLTFSIDGPDKATYENIRGERIFEQVIKNAKELIKMRKEKGLSRLTVAILCTIMKQNIRELPEMVPFAKELGMDALQFQPVVPDNTDASKDIISDTWIDEENYAILDASIDQIIKLKKNEFHGFISNSFQHLELTKLYFRKKMPMVRKCYAGFNRILVTQDHTLYFCAPDPATGMTTHGDVSKTALKALWTSKEAWQFRRHIKRCKRPCLLLCAYRPEFDSLGDKFRKFNTRIDKMFGNNTAKR
jgi:MoaA/NifB/PqqE/SkfB family radical SAM enzyme